MAHIHSMSPLLNHIKNPLHTPINIAYNCGNTPFGLKTVDTIIAGANQSAGVSLSAIGTIVTGGNGPPTPTQELDLTGNHSDQRKRT